MMKKRVGSILETDKLSSQKYNNKKGENVCVTAHYLKFDDGGMCLSLPLYSVATSAILHLGSCQRNIELIENTEVITCGKRRDHAEAVKLRQIVLLLILYGF